jgi:hypothetical protein
MASLSGVQELLNAMPAKTADAAEMVVFPRPCQAFSIVSLLSWTEALRGKGDDSQQPFMLPTISYSTAPKFTAARHSLKS